MKRVFFAFALIALFTTGTIQSQNINKLKLDSLFNILAEKNKAMGSVAISKNGRIIYNKAIGCSYISDSEKKLSNESTKYRIGSITKMFTATIIFQLIEEGKTTLNTTLSNYFPNLPNAATITISNLLNHRSGLHNFTNDPDYLTWMTSPKTEEEMLAVISKSKVDFQPGQKYEYSNSNYVILGYIIEKICKAPYSKVLKDRITSRINLKDTYYGGKTDISKNECYSYQWTKSWEQQPETDMSIPGGAGAIVSTPSDLTKFIEALFSYKLVSEKSLITMKTLTAGYGMGMVQMPFYEKKGYGHGGGIDGFVSNLIYFPEDSLALSYCTNGVVYPMNNILLGVLSIYFSKNYSIPQFAAKPDIKLATEDLDKYLGEFSSLQLPLKITVTKDKATLIIQATGQSAIPLEAIDTNKFQFEQAGIEIEFNASGSEFTLKQGGGNFLFKKGN
jgi:D-alanyl-D-alanine carboxypeptidase